ncbi:MAG: carboxyltransferase domain-containing protein, partial [Agrococcus sp.]
MTRVLPAADTALLLEAADLDEAMRLLPALRDARLPGITELVPAARTVLVRFDPTAVGAEALTALLLAVRPAEATAASGDVVTIEVRYDGQDLAEVARLLGVAPEEVVARHQAATWTVAFTGYAPGFGYLVGDDPLFDVPRRSSPRTRIPAGSVGLAGRFSGVYPRESPGGWQLIGRTDAPMWDLRRPQPALLAPGATVRFTGVERELVEVPVPSRAPVTAAHAVEVVRPGLQLLVQDLGRPGLAAQGVAASGTADRAALREANRAVGNPQGTAGLELAGGGATLRFRGAAVIALTGALVDASLHGAARGADADPPTGDPVPVAAVPVAPVPVEPGRAIAVDDGDELRI